MMENFISLDSKVINKPVEMEFKGVQISIAAAPFHTPKHAIARINNKGEIEFILAYQGTTSSNFGSRNLKEQVLEENVKIKFDPRNGRIYGFVFPKTLVSTNKKARIEIQIQEASEHLSDAVPANKDLSRENYLTAVNVLKEYASQLSGALA